MRWTGWKPRPDSDADGFIVQWGRDTWNDGTLSLSFTRQFAVDVRAEWTETDWYQPEYWQVSLDMVFVVGTEVSCSLRDMSHDVIPEPWPVLNRHPPDS